MLLIILSILFLLCSVLLTLLIGFGQAMSDGEDAVKDANKDYIFPLIMFIVAIGLFVLHFYVSIGFVFH